MIALLSAVLVVPLNLEPVLAEGRNRVGEFLVLLVALNDVINASLSLHVEKTNTGIVSGLSIADISLMSL